MGVTEYALLIVLVIGVPLLIAGAVTLWSLRQVQYRPRRRRQRTAADEIPADQPASRDDGAGLSAD